MLIKLLKYFVKKIRNESIQIGNFSNFDILRIFLSRGINLIRGIVFLVIHGKKLNWFFKGSHSTIIGLEKMTFGNTISIGSKVKISSIGSKKYFFGNNFSIRDYSVIDSFGSIKKESGVLKIGNNVGISENCFFAIRGNLYLGNDVIVGPGVKIFTENHSFELNGIKFRCQNEIRKDVIIGSNVWIGSNVTILPGVHIQDNVVIAASSVVNKNLSSGSLYGGVPAKLLKKLN
jgi:acetyltransferase-like isoleucine patch superfamily enzyme